MKISLSNTVGLEEAGVDGGGLFREFLSELLKTAFDPNRGFFRYTDTAKRCKFHQLKGERKLSNIYIDLGSPRTNNYIPTHPWARS